MEQQTFKEKYFNKIKQIAINIEEGLNTASEYWIGIFNNLTDEQIGQILGALVEGAVRFELNKLNIQNRAGNSKDINEDDIIILKFPEFNCEIKLSLRKYTLVRKEIATLGWFTGRGGKCGKKRNFICCEAEYKNEKFILHRIYVSYKQISYNDIKSTNISEKLIEPNSFLIELHKDEE